MAPPPDQTSEWSQIVVPAAAATIVSILAFIGAYFKKAAEPQVAEAGKVVAKAVGAAFVDDSTSAAILRIDANVAALAKDSRERADRDHDQEIADRAAEKAADELERRLAKNRKD